MRLLLALAALAVTWEARAANPVVVMETSQGTIKIELFEDKAPLTVKNFLDYVDEKFYDNTIFHRVIKNFMNQGGGFSVEKKQKKAKAPIKNEWQNGLSNQRGTVAMARTRDPDSATAQFFINVADNSRLDKSSQLTGNAGYCVFGKVIEGMDVVDKINHVSTGESRLELEVGPAPSDDVPIDNVIIKSIRRVEPK